MQMNKIKNILVIAIMLLIQILINKLELPQLNNMNNYDLDLNSKGIRSKFVL